MENDFVTHLECSEKRKMLKEDLEKIGRRLCDIEKNDSIQSVELSQIRSILKWISGVAAAATGSLIILVIKEALGL